MRELTNPADLAAVQAALAQGNGLSASTAASGSALAGMVDRAGSGVDSTPFLYNFSPKKLPKFATALDKMRAGTKRPVVIVPGNSVSRGHNATATGLPDHLATWPLLLAKILTSYGIPAEATSVYGADDRVTANFSLADPRVTLGSGWAVGTNPTAGGNMFTVSGGATGSLTFTPGDTFDRIEVKSFITTGQTPIEVYAGATLLGIIPATGGMRTDTFTAPSGSTVMNLKATSTGGLSSIRGWNTYTATNPKISVKAIGRGGWRLSNWLSTTSPYSPFNAISDFAPDLSIIPLDINDQEDKLALATFRSNKEQLIQKCLLSGDVVLVNEIPTNVANASYAEQLAYKAVNKSLADQYDLPLVDLMSEWVDYPTSNALGRYADSIHASTELGMWTIARAVARLFRAL